MAEQIILQEGEVTITQQRAIILGTTYALAQISSVRMGYEPRPARWILYAVFFLLMGGLLAAMQDCRVVGYFGLMVGVGSVVVYFLHTAKFWVVIHTAGGEARAIWHKNAMDTKRIVDAINEAIVRRG